ncbi:FAD-dependent oxidoreductase [Xanthobacteraceae bacterium Astr-EGSB]|uniref:NAD(P)/FAD-dependent oxidoreductase n=1 Tax=Astrobacterium formosum TaxID=3069710 RepID=UPI0027B18C3C|nr:FAD-dependent oxidoreductase [Xanthobacteraceae bacterium Astr-EGSB]
MSDPIIVVGAAQAGLQLAESLRAESYDGPLLVIGDEHHAPYQRPPLSKAFLLGEMAQDRLVLRGPEALAAKEIDLITGVTVTGIDRNARTVNLSDGRSLTYRALALATGSRARTLPLPGADLAGILVLRTIEDSRRIAESIAKASRVVVVGGGFIGLEIAAAASKAGKPVVVIEALERLLARTSTPIISKFFHELHTSHGVDIRLNTQVTGFVGDAEVSGVTTADGATHTGDLVVVGVGIIPNAELAQECGIACDRGIIVDDCSRTSDPLIVAAGDCTARRTADGTLLRLESVQNAIEQAKSGAAALIGKERPFTAAPWFWSDQYDVRLQMAGLTAGYDSTVVRGSVEERKFSLFYFKGEKLLAVDSVNRAPDHTAARRLLDAGRSPTPEQAADEKFSLISLAK